MHSLDNLQGSFIKVSDMNSLFDHICDALQRIFPKTQFSSNNVSILKQGHVANAHVYHYHDQTTDLIIKDFHHTPQIIKHTLGRISIAIEYRTLKTLQGLPGITTHAYQLNPYSLAFEFIPGQTLSHLARSGKTLPIAFFEALEKSVKQLHLKHRVHLDLRNLSNIIVSDNHTPYIIDFQAALSTTYLPNFLRIILEGIDLSGVYKAWNILCDQPLPQAKQEAFDRYTHIRNYWIFKNPLSVALYHRGLKLCRRAYIKLQTLKSDP